MDILEQIELELPPEPPWFWDSDTNAPDPELESLARRGFGPDDDRDMFD